MLFITACNILIHNILQNGPFYPLKRPISPSKTAHFIVRNGPFCIAKWAVSRCVLARFANQLLPHRFLVWPALGVLLAFPLLMSDIVRATYLPIMPRLPIKPNQPIMPNQPIKPIRHVPS